MTFSRKLLILRVSSALISFLLCWTLLVTTGSIIVNKIEIIKWIDEQNWMKFLSPDIAQFLVLHGWQIIISFVITIFIYKKSKQICSAIIEKYFSNKLPFIVSWDNPKNEIAGTEFILFIGTGNGASALVVSNTGNKTYKINDIKLNPQVSKGITNKNGDEIRVYVNSFSFQAKNTLKALDQEGNGLEWISSDNTKWTINSHFTIKEKSSIKFPFLAPYYDENDLNIVEEIRKLISDATLQVEFDMTFYTEDGPLKIKLTSPLRVFSSFEDWDDDCTEVARLLENCNIKDEGLKNKLRDRYISIAKKDFENRNAIADQLNEMFEIERFREFQPELFLFDKAIKENPKDANGHYSRGHALIEQGFADEALISFENATRFGLNSPELHIDTARALTSLSRSEEALITLNNITEEFSNSILFFETRAAAYEDLGKSAEALKDYNKLIELNPDCPKYYINRGFNLATDDWATEDAVISSLKEGLDRGYDDFDTLELLEPILDPKDISMFKALVLSYKEKKEL